MKFEDVQFNCIKGYPINDVKTHTLAEMGFPIDVCRPPDMSRSIHIGRFVSKVRNSSFYMVGVVEEFYIRSLLETGSRTEAFARTLSALDSFCVTFDELEAVLKSSCVYELSALDAETLIEEFVFIIRELLPRQLSDIYYSFDIEPNPAYAVFFDFAAKRLNLIKCEDRRDCRFGQFIGYTEEGVIKRFESGEPLISIYQKTCATKTIIKDTISSIPHDLYDSVELALFSLARQYSYSRTTNDQTGAADFVVYKDGGKIFNIICIPEEELNHIEDYEGYTSGLYSDDYPTLVLDQYGLYRGYIANVIRKAIKDKKYIETYFKENVRCFKYEKAIRSSAFSYRFAATAKLCGCYFCGSIFTPQDIPEWQIHGDNNKDGYVSCPYCDEVSVIMDSQGFEITESFLEELDNYLIERDSLDFY